VSRDDVLRDAAVAAFAYPESVGELLEETRWFFKRYVVVPDVAADAVALWNAHTYVFDVARATPYLYFWSPDPGSGKTTALEALQVTARDGFLVDDLTGAALYRFIEKERPSLLIDEVDGIFNRKNGDPRAEDIRKVLNSGYSAGKRVIRVGGPRNEDVQKFDPFCPKALAGLRELPATLAHRSIPIAMQPPRPEEAYEDFDPEEVEEEAMRLRAKLEAWAESARDELRRFDLKPAKLPELDARRNQIWRILFRIADLAGDGWLERAHAAAVELSAGDRRADEATAGIKLLGHIREVFVDERMFCAEICEELNADEELPYGGWSDGAGIKTRELGWKLKPYRIYAKSIRIGERKANGYERSQFEDAWSRYLSNPGIKTGTTGTSGSQTQKQAEKQPGQDAAVPVVETAANALGERDVAVVPVSEPGSSDPRIPTVPTLEALPSDAPEWERAYWARKANAAS
jgi:hypothetical protein